MKKILPLFLLIILSSCTGATQVSVPTSTEISLPDPVVTKLVPTVEVVADVGAAPESLSGLEVTFWYALSGEQAALMEQQIASFSLTNPYGIKVVSNRFNTLYELDQALAEVVTAPNLVLGLSDVESEEVFQAIDIVPYTKLEDLTLDSENFYGGFPENALPFLRSARFLVYNASFARELGYSNLPTNYSEFEEQICAANAFWKADGNQTNDNMGGYLLDDESSWQNPLSWMINGEPTDAEPDPIAAGKAALDRLEQSRDDGCVWYLAEANKYESLRDRKALVISMDAQELMDLFGAKTMYSISDDLVVGSYPGEVGAILSGYDLSIPSTEPMGQLAAYLFARWLTEDEQQITWAKETGLLPVTRSSVEKLLTGPTLPAWQSDTLRSLENATQLSAIPDLGIKRTLIGDGFYQWVTRYPYTVMNDIWKDIEP